MKKLLVSGEGGFVGARIMTQLAGRYELCAFPKGMLAAADEQTVADWVRREQPDVIVLCGDIVDEATSHGLQRKAPGRVLPRQCSAAVLDGGCSAKKRRKAGCVQL